MALADDLKSLGISDDEIRASGLAFTPEKKPASLKTRTSPFAEKAFGFVEETLPYIAGALGGVAGTAAAPVSPTGPLTPFLGAGLAYGGAKSGLRSLRQLAGLEPPQTLSQGMTQTFGRDVPVGMAIEGAPQAALGAGRSIAKPVSESLPSIYKFLSGIPRRATKVAQKYGVGKLGPSVTSQESSAQYAKALGQAGIGRTTDEQIGELASSVRSGGGRKKGALAAREFGIPVPFLKEQPRQIAKEYLSLKRIFEDSGLRRSFGEKNLLKALHDLRQTADSVIEFEPSTGEEKTLYKQTQVLVKNMRSKINQMIGDLPGGDIIRKADEIIGKQISKRELARPFRISGIRSTIAGVSPYLFHHAGIPYEVSVPMALASQSPVILRELLRGGQLASQAGRGAVTTLRRPLSAVAALLSRRAAQENP